MLIYFQSLYETFSLEFLYFQRIHPQIHEYYVLSHCLMEHTGTYISFRLIHDLSQHSLLVSSNYLERWARSILQMKFCRLLLLHTQEHSLRVRYHSQFVILLHRHTNRILDHFSHFQAQSLVFHLPNL